jgi:hypothetical protein
LVDPRDYRENRWHGDLADESFGVLGIGVEKDDSALFSDRFGPAVVHVGWGMKSNARMTMIVVIPSEKSGTVGVGVFEAAEAIGEVGSVLEGPDRVGLNKESPDWPPIGSAAAWLPADDLTASAVRTIPLRSLRAIALESVEKYGEGPLSEAERTSLSQRPGRAGRSDAFYAHWAARYAERIGSKAPIAELARENGLRREQVRDLIQQARERGLLAQGRSSLLTKKAKSILQKEVDSQDPK